MKIRPIKVDVPPNLVGDADGTKEEKKEKAENETKQEKQ